MSNEREREAMLRARAFIDRLTVDAPDGDPKAIVEDENRFFAWDNEHRSPKTGKTFLFDWSYYIGIVMEGLYYMYEAGAGARYRNYAKRYLRAVETGGRLNRYAGYTPDHGVDCYKTASLLPFFMDEDAELKSLADALFDDLACKNARHTEDALGGNYWARVARRKAAALPRVAGRAVHESGVSGALCPHDERRADAFAAWPRACAG